MKSKIYNSPNPPSRYLPIWSQLKRDGKVSLTAPVILHKRIIKAVQKRRDKDLAYKLDLAENNKKARIQYRIVGTCIHFRLVFSISVDDL